MLLYIAFKLLGMEWVKQQVKTFIWRLYEFTERYSLSMIVGWNSLQSHFLFECYFHKIKVKSCYYYVTNACDFMCFYSSLRLNKPLNYGVSMDCKIELNYDIINEMICHKRPYINSI